MKDCAQTVTGFVGLGLGALVSLAMPTAAQIVPERIARGISRIQRFNGNTERPFSIAAHCLLVRGIVARRTGGTAPLLEKAALLHDAHEAIIGDIVLPLKEYLGRDRIAAIEAPLDIAIGERFGIDPELFKHPVVKAADIEAVYTEALVIGADFVEPELRRWVPPDFVPDPLAMREIRELLVVIEGRPQQQAAAIIAGEWVFAIAACDADLQREAA